MQLAHRLKRTSRNITRIALLCIIGTLCWSGLEYASATLASVDTVVVIKSKRMLMLMRDGEIFKTYRVSLGRRPEGHKIASGDLRTPEGRYILDSKNPNSKYHLAIHISYPNELDIINAQKRGVSPGGEIMIHGLPPKRSNELKEINGYADWTNGCIALTNPEMEEIWQFVATGTPIEIKP
jgi:murein L,D-transpeptidase YafK